MDTGRDCEGVEGEATVSESGTLAERRPYKNIYGMVPPESVPSRRVVKQCGCCFKWFDIPTCHSTLHKSCSLECGRKLTRIAKNKGMVERARTCLECGESFVPRGTQLRNRQGKYCSTECRSKQFPAQLFSKEVMAKSRAGYWKARAENRVPFYSGPDNVKWKGGHKEAVKRRIKSGKANATLKIYRARNPEKVRDWVHRRRGKKVGRLPSGTVARILLMQRGCCANCRETLKGKYHVDHVTPLARGGQHEPKNIQILCPTCNLRKSAKDPIAFALEEGRLL